MIGRSLRPAESAGGGHASAQHTGETGRGRPGGSRFEQPSTARSSARPDRPEARRRPTGADRGEERIRAAPGARRGDQTLPARSKPSNPAPLPGGRDGRRGGRWDPPGHLTPTASARATRAAAGPANRPPPPPPPPRPRPPRRDRPGPASLPGKPQTNRTDPSALRDSATAGQPPRPRQDRRGGVELHSSRKQKTICNLQFRGVHGMDSMPPPPLH